MRKIFIIFLSAIAIAQTGTFTPTDVENAKLAKLKAQGETLQAQLQQIDIQIQALTIMKQMTNEKYQSKESEYLAYSEEVKKNHKEWGDKVVYNPAQGESGVFTEVLTKK